jgi:D-3-phosphoglycerate dehydrogenase
MVEALVHAGLVGKLAFGPESALRRDSPLSVEQIVKLAQGYDAVIGASSAPLTRPVLEALPDLKVISKLGIGHEVIDLQAATDLGIVVANTPAPSEIDAVAEHAVALILAAAKRLDYYDRYRMRNGGWLDESVRPTMIAGKVIGFVGFGRIARSTAARLSNWNARLIAYDNADVAPPENVTMVDLERLLAESDFVSLHVAATHLTEPILNRRSLDLMKPGAVVINTARGGLIDAAALAESLRSGRLTAAGLDVFSSEPPVSGDPLLELPNVFLTPHSAASIPSVERDMEMMAIHNVQVALSGQQPTAILNPVLYDGLAARRRV